jgi:hypothetical protein
MIKGSANVVVSACEEGEGDYGEESYSISTWMRGGGAGLGSAHDAEKIWMCGPSIDPLAKREKF